MLDGAESQNYGYGYGTKVNARILHYSLQTSKKFNLQVDTPTGSSTVYVHGFGTDDSYSHEGYPGGHQAYGYGHIDPYLNHKQGDNIFHITVYIIMILPSKDMATLNLAMVTTPCMAMLPPTMVLVTWVIMVLE